METFAGIPQKYAKLENSKVVLIPVVYNGTSTWGKGANKGPYAFLEAAKNIEFYDIETDSEVYRRGIFLAPVLQENFSSKKMVKKVYISVKKYLSCDKFVTLIGGEHSISIGSLRAFRDKFLTLTVLQLDAHTDLRKKYQGTPYSHACSLYESSQKDTLVQVGIRSMDIEEKKYIQQGNIFYAHILDKKGKWIQKVIDRLGKKVFITIDLDAFDPSITPSTGTPEPGGLLWYTTLKFLRKVFEQKEVVGFDIVELAPNPKESSTDFLAAKLYYKLLSYRFEL